MENPATSGEEETGGNGITGKFYFLTASMVNTDFRLTLISIPSIVLDTISDEILTITKILKGYFRNIDLLLFDRWFYSKEVMMSLNNIFSYLIFVKRDSEMKKKLESGEKGKRK